MIPLATLAFWATALATLAGAVGCLVVRHLLHAGLCLGVTLVGVAGLYLFLQAEYLAAIQVLVYVGGVLVLILLGVFFSRDLAGAVQRTGAAGWLAALVVAGLVLQVALRLVAASPGLVAADPVALHPPVDAIGNGAAAGASTLGDLFLGLFLVPFLVLAVLLTVVAVATVALVRLQRRSEPRPPVPPVAPAVPPVVEGVGGSHA